MLGEKRGRQSSELVSLKRELYSGAILKTEAVASAVAQWAAAEEDDASRQVVRAALSSAYETAGRIRIAADTQVPAEAMQQLLAVYRIALESDDRKLPTPSDVRDAMIREFRKDLGRPDKLSSTKSWLQRRPLDQIGGHGFAPVHRDQARRPRQIEPYRRRGLSRSVVGWRETVKRDCCVR